MCFCGYLSNREELEFVGSSLLIHIFCPLACTQYLEEFIVLRTVESNLGDGKFCTAMILLNVTHKNSWTFWQKRASKALNCIKIYYRNKNILRTFFFLSNTNLNFENYLAINSQLTSFSHGWIKQIIYKIIIVCTVLLLL